MNAVRAWVGVHQTRPATVMFGLVFLTVLITRNITVTRLGLQVLPHAVSLSLLVGLVPGVAAAIGASGPSLAVPDPFKVKLARAVWLCALTMVGIGCAIGAWQEHLATPGALVRNVLLMTVLAMPAVMAGRTELAWLVPLVYVLGSAQFGGDGGRTYWWAVVLDPEATATSLWVVLVAFGGMVLWYAVGGGSAKVQ